MLIIGACFGGFFFCGILHTILSPPMRPSSPEPALGYTYFLKTKYGAAYGTYFEYLAVNFGVWVTWSLGGLIGLFSWASGMVDMGESAIYRRTQWRVLGVAAFSCALFYAIWRAFNL
jgi:hypothetical protein